MSAPDEAGFSGKLESWIEQASFAQHYGLILKATDAGEGSLGGGGPDTPGYVYEELVRLTFEVDKGDKGHSLASVLVSKLQGAKTVESKVKTLKTLRHLTFKGSRNFRKGLRLHDEQLRNSAESGIMTSSSAEVTSSSSAKKVHQIRQLAVEIRTFLFDQSNLEGDESLEPETIPQSSFSGMGASTKSLGRYEGFGSAPAKETLGDKMLEMVESMMTSFPVASIDERKEVLEMCLAAPSTGDYQPIQMPGLKKDNEEMMMSSIMVMNNSGSGKRTATVRHHVPGKAGGGWESSSSGNEDEDDNEKPEVACFRTSAPAPVPDTSCPDPESVDEIGQEAREQTPVSEAKKSSSSSSSASYSILQTYLRNPLCKVHTVQECFQQLRSEEFEDVTVALDASLEQVINDDVIRRQSAVNDDVIIRQSDDVIERQSDEKSCKDESVFRLLLLLEHFLRSSEKTDEMSKMKTRLDKHLVVVASEDNNADNKFLQKTVIKAQKVRLIIQRRLHQLQP